MKGEKILTILDVLFGVSCNTIALFLAMSSGERTSAGIRRVYRNLAIYDYHILRDTITDIKEIRRFRNLLSYLKKSGLIDQSEKSKWRITKSGIKKLLSLRDEVVYRKKYKRIKGDQTVIFIFDIPERERKKRNWVRRVLRELDFRMLQKSVWLGKVKLSKEFIKDLKRMNLMSYVHIFSIKERGSINLEKSKF